MSCVSHCDKCDAYYTEPKEFWTALDKGCDEKGHYSSVIKCRCGSLRITGGESTEAYGEKGTMMFSQQVRDEAIDTFDQFDVTMLTECEKDDPELVGTVWHSFGYCLAPGSTGRTVSLKPGKPKYIFRGLPCNCENEDPYRIRWAVSGQYQGMSGILEWCKSRGDAESIAEKINTHIQYEQSLDKDHAEVEMFGINRDYTDSFGEKKVHTEITPRCLQYAIGDIVGGYFSVNAHTPNDNVFVIGRVSRVVPDINPFIVFVQAANIAPQRDGDTGKYQPVTFRFEAAAGSCLFPIMIKRSKIKRRPYNAYRDSENKSMNNNILATLPFYIPNRVYRAYLSELFYKQYTARKDSSFNKKLFKRWLRQNWSKVLVPKRMNISSI